MADKPSKVRSLRARLASPFGAIPALVKHTTTALSALMVLASIVSLVVFYRPMEAHAAGLTGAPLRVIFNWPLIPVDPAAPPPTSGGARPRTTWLDPASREMLEGIALRTLSPLPSDHDSLERTQKALTATGWFAEPLRVRRLQGGVVRIAGKWRIPAAVVRHQPAAGPIRDRLVSGAGELLPPSYNEGASGLKIVLHPMLDPPDVGDVWLGGDVHAALALLDFLRPARAYDQIAAVDAAAYATDKQLTLVTDRGTRILWGAPPGQFAPGQAPADVKRARLERLLTDYGRVDAGLHCIDLRLMENVYEVRPPSVGDGRSASHAPRGR